MDLVRMVLFVAEGLLGTAALLVFPAIIYLLADAVERRVNKTTPSDTTKLMMENHVLDRLNERMQNDRPDS